MTADPAQVVRLGEISGVHGVRGWVKVHSYTEPKANLIEYRDWLLEAGGRRWSVRVEEGTLAGRSVIAKLDGIDDRDAAETLVGAHVFVPRASLPPCAPDEFYWTDLEGLEVRTLSGDLLGKIARLMPTGANDVIVLAGPDAKLIPYIAGQIVRKVDLEAGVMVVAWDASYWE